MKTFDKFISGLKPLGFFALTFFLISTKLPSTGGVIDHFKIGDVIYSVLNAEQFRKIHGNGWHLLDGADIKNEQLQKFYPSQLISGQYLPNANGQFVRSMNGGVSATEGADPVKGRIVGSSQNQDLIAHAHTFSAGGGSSGPRNAISIDTNPSTTITTTTFGGTETRPTNIALYMYIKIND
jgi:hypothetical protein